jgi:hypothetical protein
MSVPVDSRPKPHIYQVFGFPMYFHLLIVFLLKFFQMANLPQIFRITTTGPIPQEVVLTEYEAHRKMAASKMAFNVRFVIILNQEKLIRGGKEYCCVCSCQPTEIGCFSP